MAISKTNRRTWVRIALFTCLLLSFSSLSRGTGQDPKQSFAAFAGIWIDQIQNAYLYTRTSPNLETTATGFVASYHYLDEASIRWDVKPAEGQEGVYTAVLYYTEHLVQSRAPTEEQARQGPFSIVATQQMMEIFLYENGAWVR